MSLPGNGIFVVQGEMAILVTAMRRGSRWGSHSTQDEEHDILMRAFQDLRDILNQVADLRLLDPNVFLGPFLEVIRSEKTTGNVTCLALSAINKFLCYGLIDPMHASVPAGVENIADAVTHARFVGTDHSSDGVVLMKILQVLRTLVLSPEGAMLTDESVCEIMLSCFRICFETRLSELLRRNAEQCLRDMTQLVFMRLPQFCDAAAEEGAVEGGALSLRRRTNSVRRGRSRAQEKSTVLSPMVKLSSSTPQLSATPVTTSAQVVDMQGNISQTPTVIELDDPADRSDAEKSASNQIETESDSLLPNVSPADQSKSPSKKHGRHSSMDLAASENIYITHLVEKCVNSSETITPSSSDADLKEKAVEECVVESEAIQVVEDLPQAEVTIGELEQSVKEETDGQKVSLQAKRGMIEYKEEEEIEKDYINPRGVRFISQDEQVNLQPYGLICVRELFRFLISLCNPIDPQNTSSMVYLGLCLVETALEVGADHLAKYPSFLQLVKDPLCRNLLSLLSSDRVSMFALDLQVSFLLFESLRTHLKLQLEAFFTKLVEIIMSDSAKNSYESKEITHLALESIAQMWRIPGLCTELYLNYDCDIYCSNLLEDITKLLSKTIVTAGVHNYHTLALDALFTVIDSIEANCHQIKSNEKINNVAFNSTDDTGQVAIDMCDSFENGDDTVVHDISQYISSAKMGRHKPNANLPNEHHLEDTKNKKRWIATGTEHFNQKPEKGIEFLQEHGILATPLDPLEIAHFLRNNPGLDKKMIGEYISKKKNVESRILATYAASFDMTGLRVDQALRLYLETFRLPGEAPLIFLVMEHFSEHWHECNGNPFANTDAAFRLAYAIIMLNMDQHNHNAKKLNIPMTVEEFVRNLRGCNGSNDFDPKMLEAVFNSIKNEEIVMPAERTGIVKENYMWKVLLRRGTTKEGLFVHSPSGAFDKQLFMLTWGPLVAALSSIFEKSSEPNLYSRALEGFDKCASIVAYYSLTSELDTIVLSLCKFTGLLSLPESLHHISIGASLGQSAKSRCALKKVFCVCHRHANSLREGWKHILEVILALFRARLLPKDLTEADDFCSASGKISLIREASAPVRAPEAGLLSSLYSYIALSADSGSTWQRQPSPEESQLLQQAQETVAQCNVQGLLVTDSKFLQLDSLQELVKYVIAAGKPQELQKSVGQTYRDDPTIFFLEVLIQIVIQNRDRVSHIWQATETHVTGLMITGAASSGLGPQEAGTPLMLERLGVVGSTSGLLERSSTGLLRLAICLMRSEECASIVLRSLKAFLQLTYPVYHSISSRVAVGLFELVKTSAQNIHTADDWTIVFTLLETTGAGAMHLKEDDGVAGSKSDGAMSSEDDSVSTDRGYTSDSEISHSPQTQGWILVGGKDSSNQSNPPLRIMEDPLIHPCSLRPHDARALLKCWECLAFIVRDVAHITPYNFEACVNCIRTFVEASLHGTNEEKVTSPSHLHGRRRKVASHARRVQKSQPSSYNNRPSDGSDDSEAENVPDGYQLISIQLLDLMHTLHSRTAQIFKWWREESNFTSNLSEQGTTESRLEWCDLWHLAWQPLLQGIARLCTDNRKQVANSAVTYLQRALLVLDLQTLSGEEWESAFHCVLFPLLARPQGRHQEVRLRANTIMCKVFLHHLTPLVSRPSFPALWLQLLELLRSMLQGGPHSSDLLHEATLESLKNMLLVMDSVKVFNDGDGYSDLWNVTWERINTFLPNLKDELFPKNNSRNQVSRMPPPQEPSQQPPLGDVPPLGTLPSASVPGLSPTSPPPSEYQKPYPNFPVGSNTIPIPGGAVPANPVNIPTANAQGNMAKGSSIILQPPMIGSQVHTPIFAHLGQMSTPIGVAVPVSSQNDTPPYPILCPNPLPQKYSHYNNQLPLPAGQLINMASQQNQNIAANPSPFTLISPQQNSILDPNHTNAENGNAHGSNLSPSNERINLQDVYAADYVTSPASINIEVQQPRSLYGEYLTNPYNPLPDVPLPSIKCEEPALAKADNILQHDFSNSANANESSQFGGSASNLDKNFNIGGSMSSSANVLQKSHSVTCSPAHATSHTNTFGSSDNIKSMTQATNADSGMFSFSKYFYTDSTNIPPGSEMLFGDNSLNSM